MKYETLEVGMVQVNKELRDLVKQDTEVRNMPVSRLAKAIGVSQPQLRRFICEAQNLNAVNLQKIAEHYGFDIRVELVKRRGK